MLNKVVKQTPGNTGAALKHIFERKRMPEIGKPVGRESLQGHKRGLYGVQTQKGHP